MAYYPCDMCGESLGEKPWVQLNRVGYGTGRCRGYSAFLDESGDCQWDVGDELDAEPETVSGPVLCFPGCLNLFIEGRMIQADIAKGHTK